MRTPKPPMDTDAHRWFRKSVSICVYLWLTSLPVFAAFDGTIINRTTGQPAPGTIVSLVQPGGGGGMQTLASVKTDAQGKFKFDRNAQGPTLVQAFYGGVFYNKMVPPGTPSTGLEIDVFDSSNKPGTAKVNQHFIVLQPGTSEMAVSEGILYQNDARITYTDPVNGSFHFYLPPEAKGQVSVTINAPGGMPIQRQAEKTKTANVYKVDYPIKPGETRFDLNFTVPITNPMIFSGKILHTEGTSDLVIPSGVTVKADNLELAGQEPKTQASIYRIKGDAYTVAVAGTGSLQGGADSSASGSDEDNGAPNIEEVKPRIYDQLYWILGIAFATLALGSVVLYRSHTAKKT